jgi:hypothetical protein
MDGKLKLDMQDVKPGARLYLQMSGGLDSSYLAWRLLRDGYKLLIWHCSFRTHQERWPHEDAAYANVVAWLRRQRLTQFEELPSGLYSPGGAIIGWRLDYTFLWPEAGFHLRNKDHMGRRITKRQDVRHIVIPNHAESRSVDGAPLKTATRQMCHNAGRTITPLYPMARYSRPEYMADMPTDLIDLSWWCRKPNNGRPCRRCSTCQVVDPALRSIGYRMEERLYG